MCFMILLFFSKSYAISFLFPLFLFCPVVLLMGVSLTTNIWFGASSLSFHTIPDAATSVLMAAIGDFRTDDLLADYRYPQSEVILLAWSLLMGFVVLTMFVAIVGKF